MHGWAANNRMSEYQASALVEQGCRYESVDLRSAGTLIGRQPGTMITESM